MKKDRKYTHTGIFYYGAIPEDQRPYPRWIVRQLHNRTGEYSEL